MDDCAVFPSNLPELFVIKILDGELTNDKMNLTIQNMLNRSLQGCVDFFFSKETRK